VIAGVSTADEKERKPRVQRKRENKGLIEEYRGLDKREECAQALRCYRYDLTLDEKGSGWKHRELVTGFVVGVSGKGKNH